MIFDFRMRPPYKSFCNLGIFTSVCNESGPQKYHAIPSEAARQKNLDLFWKEMDEAGISSGVIIGRQLPDDSVSVSNDDILEMAREYPEKIIPFGSLDITRGVSQTLDELDRILELGIKGVAMEPACSMPPRKADANVLYPVYAKCEKAGIPMVLTMSFFQGDLDFSEPSAVQHAAHDFPRLPFIIAHGAYPWTPMAYQLPIVCPNIWLLPDIYAYNPMVPGNQMFGEAMRWLDGEHILFGSCYPCYNMKQAIDDMRRFNLPPSLLEKFFYKNAMKLLKLPC